MWGSALSVNDMGVLQILCEGVELRSVNDDAGTEDWTMGCDMTCEEPKNRVQVKSE
jgi:hypothetical protein